MSLGLSKDQKEFLNLSDKKFTIVYQGPKLWNPLPLKLKLNLTLKTFKAYLKTSDKVVIILLLD